MSIRFDVVQNVNIYLIVRAFLENNISDDWLKTAYQI